MAAQDDVISAPARCRRLTLAGGHGVSLLGQHGLNLVGQCLERFPENIELRLRQSTLQTHLTLGHVAKHVVWLLTAFATRPTTKTVAGVNADGPTLDELHALVCSPSSPG